MKGKIKRHTGAAILGGAVALMATAAFAFFAASYIGEGSHEASTGSKSTKTLQVPVNFAAGLTPETPEPVTIEVENTTAQTAKFTKAHFTIATPAVAQCAGWLELKAMNGANPGTWNNSILKGEGSPEPLEMKPGTHSLLSENTTEPVGEVVLMFNPTTAATTNQSVCENTPVKVSVKLES